LLSYGHLKIFTLGPETGDQTSDTGHVCDFISCPMLLCSTLDRRINQSISQSVSPSLDLCLFL